MGVNKLFGILLAMLMLHFNTVEMKSLSESSAIAEKIINDELPGVKDLHYKTILNVAPFLYLPDLAADNHTRLLQYIQREFQKLYPDILLILRPKNYSDNFYDTQQMINWLSGDNPYDIIEIDTVILGDLVDAGVAYALPIYPKLTPPDWHPAAASAVQINDAVYAYPHLMCAEFLFTRETSIASAFTVDQLVLALKNFPSNGGHYLYGNMNSTWDLTALYVDSYREAYFPMYVPNSLALNGEWNTVSLESLRKLLQLCNNQGFDPCLDGSFASQAYPEVPASAFASGLIKAMFGYSERLHTILKYIPLNAPANLFDIKIKPLPVGNIPNEPLFFTDAYVVRRGMPKDKIDAAIAFITFMGTPAMQAAVAATEIGVGPYRYLLPMSKSAYSVYPISIDPYYQKYLRNLTGGSFPNTGFSKLRKPMGNYIADYIRQK